MSRLPIAALVLLACSPQDGRGPAGPPVPADWSLIAPEVRPLALEAAARCRKNPADSEALAALGRLYHANEAPALAAAAYERALALSPRDARTLYFLGLVREDGGDAAQALASFAAARDLEPAQPWIRHHLGTVLLEAGRAGDAIVELREAVRLDSEEPAFRIALARALRQTGQLEEALLSLQVALARAPDNPGAHQVAALVLNALGRKADAAAHVAMGRVYHADVVRDPWFRDVQKLSATVAGQLVQSDLMLENGKTESAVRLLEPLAKAHPERADVHRKLGRALALSGDLARARGAYARAAAIEPGDPRGRADLAMVLLDLGDKDGAALHAKEALAADADLADARVVLAATKLRSGDAAGALADADLALRTRKDLVLAFVVRGDALLALGRAAEAADAFESALRIAPSLAYAKTRLTEARSASRRSESR